MDSLHRKPTTNKGLVHNITPENAGWRYVGFDLYRLSSGQSANGATGDREVIIVVVEGKAHIKSSENDWGVLGDRMSVFEKTPPLACISLMITNGKLKHPQNAPWPYVPLLGRGIMSLAWWGRIKLISPKEVRVLIQGI